MNSNTTPQHIEAAPVLLADGEQFFDDKSLASLLNCSPRTIWLMSKRGQLPKPEKIGGTLTRWRASDLRKALTPKAEGTIGMNLGQVENKNGV